MEYSFLFNHESIIFEKIFLLHIKMKKIKLLQFLVLGLMFIFTSCVNEPIDTKINLNPETPVLPILFKVSFSGQTFTTTQAEAVFSNDGHITINAVKNPELESFDMDIIGTTPGLYLTKNNIITYSAGISQPSYISINPTDALSDTGQITITSIDVVNNRISGNFNFTGYYNNETVSSTKEFTNGVFTNIPYTTSN